ncbi:MAG: radical SAM protein [Selenomonadaceae bacterium]|nr:radical SAM protein [Selenomonadaceae bacterium]
MNILFVYPRPDEIKRSRFGFSMNIAYASSVLKFKGNSTYFVDLSVQDLSNSQIFDMIEMNSIDRVFVEMDSFALKRSSNNQDALEILKLIKHRFTNLKTIAFGHACIMKREEVDNADETITCDILKYLLGGDYEYDSLPFPDRDLIESVEYYSAQPKSTLIQTSKGCLNSCIFCQRQGWQNKFLAHDIDYVCREFYQLQERGYKNIWIQDENFTFNLSRAKSLLKRIIAEHLTDGMKISMSSWTKIDEEFLQLAARANIRILSMGIESANLEVLKFYRKDIDLERVKHLIGVADSLGIFTVGNFIIGAPVENLAMINRTFDFIQRSGLDQVNIKTLDFMIGSKLYEMLPRDKFPKDHYFGCLENGLGQISLKELESLKSDFLKRYNLSQRERLAKKIVKFGTPYED